MRQLFLTVILTFSAIFLISCDMNDIVGESPTSPDNSNQVIDQDTVPSLDYLERTEYFNKGALVHILAGELNRDGQAVGFHYDGLPSKKGDIVSGTETKPDEHGVFEAKVEVNGTKKTSNDGVSSFFPNDWDAQEVVEAINEAYDSKQLITGNTYEGLDTNGVVIRMYLDDHGKIISAFPVY